jgi:uncharacterized protein (TIGR02271 family)
VKYNDIPWNETIKKEARGIDDADFGEIQSVDPEFIITQKGIIDKEIFSFPIDLAQDYDGNTVLFKVTEEEARNSYMQSQNIEVDQDYHGNSEIETENTTTENISRIDESLNKSNGKEEIIPLMSEELDVNKRVVVDERIITKKPIKETKTVEIQLTREVIESIERRPPTNQETKASDPVQAPEKIKILLKREEPEVSKRPYVKEEVVVTKKIVTNKKKITDEITSEELETENINR